ncbi:MAG: YitT family protein [Erysipelotrichaceae bacterium]
MKKDSLHFLKDALIALFAAFVAAVNINSFINDGNIVPAGFSGIALLTTRLADKYNFFCPSYSFLYIALNIPAVILVMRTVGKKFTVISLIDVVFTSVFVAVLPKFHITNDFLLAAVFAGIINGFSNSLVLSADGSGGGLDFITIYAAKKYKKSFWNEAMLINATIISIAAFAFGLEAALYSIIYQFVCTQVISFADSRYKRSSLIIISEKSEEICAAVYRDFHHTVTIWQGVGGYTSSNRKVLYTVCGQYETNALVGKILLIDPKAFVNVTQSQKVIGNFHEKPFY